MYNTVFHAFQHFLAWLDLRVCIIAILLLTQVHCTARNSTMGVKTFFKEHYTLFHRAVLELGNYDALRYCAVDVLWRQQIKLIQVVSTSEFHEY